MPKAFVTVGKEETARLTGDGLGGTAFGEIALDADDGTLLPLAVTNTTLGDEIVDSGLARKTGGDVTKTVETTTTTNDTVKQVVNWLASADKTAFGFGLFNGAATDILNWRVLFDEGAFNLVSGDSFTLSAWEDARDKVVASDSVLTTTGLEKAIRAKYGLTGSNTLKAVALGQDDGTTLPLAQSNTALGDEILAADALGLARGQETSGPTVSLVTTTETDDTTRVESQWTLAADASFNEMAAYDSLAEATGEAWLRFIFPSVLNMASGDTFTGRVDIPNEAV